MGTIQTVKLARCRCTPSHLEPFACPEYGPCDPGAHVPNAAGTACERCGLHAETVDPETLAAALVDEISRFRLGRIIATESVALMDGSLAIPVRALIGGVEAERLERARSTRELAPSGLQIAEPGSARWVAEQPGYLIPKILTSSSPEVIEAKRRAELAALRETHPEEGSHPWIDEQAEAIADLAATTTVASATLPIFDAQGRELVDAAGRLTLAGAEYLLDGPHDPDLLPGTIQNHAD